MNKRKFWLFAFLLIPLALGVPLYNAASWRPRAFGVHPFRASAAAKVAFNVPLQHHLRMSPNGTRLVSFTSQGHNAHATRHGHVGR